MTAKDEEMKIFIDENIIDNFVSEVLNEYTHMNYGCSYEQVHINNRGPQAKSTTEDLRWVLYNVIHRYHPTPVPNDPEG
jgi:hypothetical protein